MKENKVKMTPTLAKAIAEEVKERANKVNGEKLKLKTDEIRNSKAYKKLCDMKDKYDSLSKEIEEMKSAIGKEMGCKISGSYSYGNQNKDKYFSITFDNAYINVDLLKGKILLKASLTESDYKDLVEEFVKELTKE